MGTNGNTNGKDDYLQIREVSRVYGGGGGVRSVSVDVGRGEMLVLLGPSGCGKTTLLRTIAGLTEVDSGTVLLGGDDITRVPTHRRNVGMVFQTWALFPHMTVAKNVGYGLRMQGVAKAEIDERVVTALAMVRMDQFADRKPKQLSGGQQQRLCIARTLAVNPDIILMDEPASALDPISTSKIEELVHELKEKYTILIVTHNMQQAARVSDHTAFFYMGELIEMGKTDAIFTKPAKKQTEDYITGRFG